MCRCGAKPIPAYLLFSVSFVSFHPYLALLSPLIRPFDHSFGISPHFSGYVVLSLCPSTSPLPLFDHSRSALTLTLTLCCALGCQALHANTPSMSTVKSWMRQLLSGLSACHSQRSELLSASFSSLTLSLSVPFSFLYHSLSLLQRMCVCVCLYTCACVYKCCIVRECSPL